MTARIFYSWQSDIKAAACRTLIQEALGAAASGLVVDEAVEVLPVIDRDTDGVPGAPDIGATILSKIDVADAFVADVTLVGNIRPDRAVPNPNVLLELGYALKALGDSRVVLVQNVAFGGPESLPFDLRQKRVLKFNSSPDDLERAPARKQLASSLKGALASILKHRREQGSEVPASTRYQVVLNKALSEHLWIQLDSAVEMDIGAKNTAGRPQTFPAPLEGKTSVREVDEHNFSLGFCVKGHGGITVVTVPFGQVEDAWVGPEGRVHLLLRRTLVLQKGTYRFV